MTLEDAGPDISLAALADSVDCAVVTAADDGWDAARRPWNLVNDQRPDAVVIPESTDDVQTVMTFARQHRLHVVTQGTGHLSSPLGDLSGAILVRTSLLTGIEIDVQARTVHVGAGVLWQDVTRALAEHGLMALSGSSGDVGVVGYLLGGGYSWFARRHGLAVNRVTAIDLVVADGRSLHVTEDNEPELFWALRGGGGNFGVVTAMTFDVMACVDVYAGMLLFPLDSAPTVARAYEIWTRQLSEKATTCLRLLRMPPLPDVPERLRGRSFVGVDGAIDLPDDADAARMLEPLRELGPIVDTFRRIPVGELSFMHLDPHGPVPGVSDGVILEDLTDDAISAILANAGPDVESPLLAVDLRHLGGAAGVQARSGGAVSHLAGRFVLYAVGIAPTPERGATVGRAVDQLLAAIAPWTAPIGYSNLRDSRTAPTRLWSDTTLERLRAVKHRYDPEGIIRSSHELY